MQIERGIKNIYIYMTYLAHAGCRMLESHSFCFIALPSNQIVPSCCHNAAAQTVKEEDRSNINVELCSNDIRTKKPGGGTRKRVSGGPEKLTAHSVKSHQSMTYLAHAGCRMLESHSFCFIALPSNQIVPSCCHNAAAQTVKEEDRSNINVELCSNDIQTSGGPEETKAPKS